MLPVLVNDRSKLTYHCSRAIITSSKSKSKAFSIKRGRRSLLFESFRPFERGIIGSIGSLLNFRGIYEVELWKYQPPNSREIMRSRGGEQMIRLFFIYRPIISPIVIIIFNEIPRVFLLRGKCLSYRFEHVYGQGWF